MAMLERSRIFICSQNLNFGHTDSLWPVEMGGSVGSKTGDKNDSTRVRNLYAKSLGGSYMKHFYCSEVRSPAIIKLSASIQYSFMVIPIPLVTPSITILSPPILAHLLHYVR